MSADAPPLPHATPSASPGAPPWLSASTLREMRQATERAFAWGRDALAAAEAAREVARSRHPALPESMIEEAVAAVIPAPDGGWRAASASAAAYTPAADEDVAQALAYALRFSETGRPRRTGHEHLAPLAAAQLVAQLRRSGFAVVRRGAANSG